MRFRIKCEKDNWIDEWSSNQLYNYGADNVLKLYKDSTGYSRIISKFDMLPFYTFLVGHNLSMTSISSCNLNYYDIQNFYLIDKNYTSELKMAGATVEIKLLSSEFDEGIGSVSNALTGYSNWIYRSENVAWNNEGGDSATATITSSFVNHFDNLSVDVTTHITTLNSSYTSGSADTNYGFLIKLLTSSETGADTFGSKEFISNDTQTIFTPGIIVDWIKNYKDESTSFEYGRINTFGITNMDTNLQPKNITSITSVTLSATTGSGTAAVVAQISTSSNVEFTTVIAGYHTFDFEIPNSLSAYTSPFLTVTYSDGTSKTKTITLTQTKSLSTDEVDNIFSGVGKIKYYTSPVEIDLDNTTVEFTRINVTPYYVESSNQQVNFIFDQTRTIVKGLEYALVEEQTQKVIQTWEFAHYNDKQNFILIHNSLLDKDKKYRLDLLGLGSAYSVTFTT